MAKAAIELLLVAAGRLSRLVDQAADMPREAALQALARALDEIATAYHGVPDGQWSEECVPEAPYEYERLAAAVSKAFPELGFYAAVKPFPVPNDAVTVGDGVDDLAAILVDLTRIQWRAERSGFADAASYARLMQGHTLRHLFNLRSVLHHHLFNW